MDVSSGVYACVKSINFKNYFGGKIFLFSQFIYVLNTFLKKYIKYEVK